MIVILMRALIGRIAANGLRCLQPFPVKRQRFLHLLPIIVRECHIIANGIIIAKMLHISRVAVLAEDEAAHVVLNHVKTVLVLRLLQISRMPQRIVLSLVVLNRGFSLALLQSFEFHSG